MTLLHTAYFAGGCFWCMEPVFDKQAGVEKVIVGYTGGDMINPTYEAVCQGNSGHIEAVQITFDPDVIGYQQLLDLFWHNIDPTVKNRQFCDVGQQYQTAIFYMDEEQYQLALSSKEQHIETFNIIHTLILPAQKFYPAEEYHQQYYKKNPMRYQQYKIGCGRDKRLKELWKL